MKWYAIFECKKANEILQFKNLKLCAIPLKYL